MEIHERATTGNRSSYARAAYWSASAACFAVLALLNGRDMKASAGFVSVYVICMLAFALSALAGLGGLVYACNPTARGSRGYPYLLDVLSRGFVYLLPFTLLALLAELALGWNASQVFTQAGIMTCGVIAGTEIVGLSGGRMVHLIAPVAGSFAFSFLWILLSAASQAAAR
jgi:hypothetical protein